VGNKLLMLFLPFLRKWTYTRVHEQVDAPAAAAAAAAACCGGHGARVHRAD
jgi:hypothetical protein